LQDFPHSAVDRTCSKFTVKLAHQWILFDFLIQKCISWITSHGVKCLEQRVEQEIANKNSEAQIELPLIWGLLISILGSSFFKDAFGAQKSASSLVLNNLLGSWKVIF
jgi:hypothetical protein